MQKKDKGKNNQTQPRGHIDTRIIIAIITAAGIVLAALIGSYFNFLSLGQKGEEYELWSVTGKISLEDSQKFDIKDVIISIKPPDQDLYRSGVFVIQNIPIKPDGIKKPSLLIKKTGYKIIEVILEEKPHKFYEEFKIIDYSITCDEKNKIIEIGEPVTLQIDKITPE